MGKRYTPPARKLEPHEMPDVGTVYVRPMSLGERQSMRKDDETDEQFNARLPAALLSKFVVHDDNEQVMDETEWDEYSATFTTETSDLLQAVLGRAGVNVDDAKSD